VGSDARSPGETVMEDKATDKTAGGVAVAAGLVAAVKLARVESRGVGQQKPSCEIGDCRLR